MLMKKLFFFLILAPLFSFSQMNERAQKMQVRSYGSLSSPSSSSFNRSFDERSRFSESNQKFNTREENRSRINSRPPVFHNPDPFWWGWGGWGSWSRWGAPMFGFSYWDPWFWHDPWGYRNPARIYVYNDGRRDTIKGKAARVSFGVQVSSNKSSGAFLTIGNRAYFIAEYNRTFQNDFSAFYPDLTMDVVLPWGDKRLPDLRRESIFYAGMGKRVKRTGIHAMIGIGTERERYQFEDELRILSNNGRYSIPNYRQNIVTFKLGVIHDFKLLTTKADLDPVRKTVSLGLGVNL